MLPFPGLESLSREVQLPSGIRLHVYDNGAESKPPIILLHGLGDEADTWRHVIPFLLNDYRVIAPDLPGFGRSDKGKRKYSVPFFVDTLLELMDDLKIPRVSLVGHSTGAVIAHEFALEHPERTDRLILISGSLVSKQNQLSLGLLIFLLPGLGEWMYKRLRKDPVAAYATLQPYYNHLDDLPAADRDFLFQRVNERVWSDGQRRGFLSTLRNLAAWLPSQQKGLPARLAEWNVPTSVVWGENDRIVSIANAQALVEMLPNSRLVVVPGAGHNVQQENAQVVAEAIKA